MKRDVLFHLDLNVLFHLDLCCCFPKCW